MDVEEGEMGDDEAPTSWWADRNLKPEAKLYKVKGEKLFGKFL